MLRPKDIRENLDNFNTVATDAVEHMLAIRGADDVVPDLEGELLKWATECKYGGPCARHALDYLCYCLFAPFCAHI